MARRRAQPSVLLLLHLLFAVLLAAAAPAGAAPSSPAAAVRMAPGESGSFGAWLLLGPFRSASHGLKGRAAQAIDVLSLSPQGVDEAALQPSAASHWIVASSNDGPIDLRAALHPTEADVVAYAAGTLHVTEGGRLYLRIGADDGVRVSIDGKVVFARDEPRPERDDDDLVALDLSAGDHPVLLKLHQREGGWAMHVRLVDASLEPPHGAYLELPGTTADDARTLAAKMSWVSVDRGAEGDAYRPKLTVRFPEGFPLGVPLAVGARLLRGSMQALEKGVADPSTPPLFDLDAGEVPTQGAGAGKLVVDLPPLSSADFPRDEDWTYEVRAAGRTVRFPLLPRRAVLDALARADRVLPALEQGTGPAWLLPGTIESVRHLADRARSFASHSDTDVGAQLAEARELDAALADLEKQVDPYARRTGLMRRAYRSPVDGELAEYGLYVPPRYRGGARVTPKAHEGAWPLIVTLHGLNGRPMAMIRYLFGGDDPKKDNEWEDRHPLDPLPLLDAFVVAPSGHGNTMYRDLGEDDVMRVVDEAMRLYPIDRNRISITGPSMGGIGSAAVPLHHPDVFAAAEPLCGYHSYFVRRDVQGRPMRPWERFLAEERSNVSWADNGARLPLWIVHGTQDLPEANSGVLIKRYQDLDYSITHDHPDLGHNVWQWTYENLRGAEWLLQFHRDPHPRTIHFRTARLRYGDDAWVHVQELAAPDAWGEVDARVRSSTAIDVTTKGIVALALDRDERLLDRAGAITVRIDGGTVSFAEGEPLALHKEGDVWAAGPAHHDAPFKHGNVTGPLRDAFHEPLLFVYGADDPAQTHANEEVARAWASMRWGVTVHYPVLSDAEFLDRGEPLANERALFLVGNAQSNRVLRALEPDLPIKVDESAVVVGTERFTGEQLGAAFVRPNPKRPDRYLVVVEGVDALGTWRSLSLPDLIPDFIVYDARVAPSRGQILLGAGMARAAGFFRQDWSLPATLADPLAAAARPSPKTEHDATEYLP